MTYKRIILKLTGEAFSSENDHLDVAAVQFIAKEIKEVYNLGAEIGIVVGGGNIVRGRELEKEGIEGISADYMGMLGTVINGVLLKSILEQLKIDVRLQTALEIRSIAEQFIRGRAIKHFAKKRIVIFACGTGNPRFSTDTAAVLRASEIKAQAVFKATKVDGLYDSDPKINHKAKFIKEISYEEAFSRQLKFMDSAAIGWAMENCRLPIHIFNIFKKGNFLEALKGEIGSKIT